MAGFYRRFCPNFASVAAPLTKLTSPKAPLAWKLDCQLAFDSLIEFLINDPVLLSPNFSSPLCAVCGRQRSWNGSRFDAAPPRGWITSPCELQLDPVETSSVILQHHRKGVAWDHQRLTEVRVLSLWCSTSPRLL